MILSLVKKDFMIIKKYILFSIAIAIWIPLFVIGEKLMGVGMFLITVIYAQLILEQQISMTELKYPRVQALLCSTPYSRRNIVIARYIFFVLIFAGCCILYGILSLVVPKTIVFSIDIVLIGFFVNVLIYGAYTPFQYKFGIMRMRFIYMAVLMASTFGAPLIANSMERIDLSILAEISVSFWRIALFLIPVIVLMVSAWISISIYSKKEL